MYCEEKLSQETPGNQMAPSMLHCTHTFIKDYFRLSPGNRFRGLGSQRIRKL